MKSNKTLSIIGLAGTFCVCFAIGFFIPVDGLIKGKGNIEAVVKADAAAQAKTDSLAAAASAAEAAETSAADKANNTPVIEGCYPKKIQSFGYNLSVTASVPSADPLSYALCEVGSTEPKYKFDNGYIGSRQHVIVPSESGSYDLIVTNTRTGDSVKKTVTGFNMVSKMSASQLQTYLNSDSYAEDFYSYLVEAAKQKIEFENLPAWVEGLTNVNTLGPARIAYGWTFEVVPGSLKYDKYNRIQSFKLRVIE